MRTTREIRWVPVKVAAEDLGISRQRVLALIDSGGLAAEFVGNQWLVSVSSIEQRREAQRKGEIRSARDR